jgi:tetratricopeptide (TPR) repeat protein
VTVLNSEDTESELRNRLKQARKWVEGNQFQKAWDSMASLVDKTPSFSDGMLAVDIINEAGRSRKFLKNDDTAKSLLEKGLEQAMKINYRFGQAYALNYLGSFFRDKNQFQEALEFYEQGLKIFEELEETLWLGNVNKNIAACYGSLGRLQDGQPYIERALASYQKMNYKKGVYWSKYQLASAYYNDGDLPESAKYIQEAISLAEELENEYDVIAANFFAGVVFKRQGKLDEAKIIFEELVEKLRIYNGSANVESFFKTILFNLAHTYQFLGEYDKAETIFLDLWNRQKEATEIQGIPASDGLARLALDQGQLRKAARYFEEAISTMRLIGHHDLVLVEQLVLLSTVKAELSEFKPARELLDEARMTESKSNYCKLLILYGEGVLAQAERNLPLARESFEKCLNLAQVAALKEYEIRAVVHLAILELYEFRISGAPKNLERMRELLEKAQSIARASLMPVFALKIAMLQGLSFSAALDFDSAIAILEESMLEADHLGLTAKSGEISDVLSQIREDRKKAIKSVYPELSPERVNQYLTSIQSIIRTWGEGLSTDL